MNAGPLRTDTLDGETVAETIADLHRGKPLRVVVFAGGEPTLAKDALRQGIHQCHALGIRSRLVTNAGWAVSFPRARRMIEYLRSLGLNEINFSADDYHLPDIPFENIVRAWKVSKCAGFSGVVVANGSGPGNLVTPAYIQERMSEKLPLRFLPDGQEAPCMERRSDGTYYGISNTGLHRLARAQSRLPEGAFQEVDYYASLGGRCANAVRNAALSPKGNFLCCCGFELDGNDVLDFGSVREDGVVGRLQTGLRDPIVRGIAYLGPAFLEEVVEEIAPDIIFPKNFGSLCEVCQSVVRTPEAVAVLRRNLGRYVPVTEAVAARLEKRAG